MASTKKEPWISVPSMPLVSNIFLPTAPIPKTSEEVDFAAALAPCIRKGREGDVDQLLQELTAARRTALASLDPSRTISSAEAVTSDAKKYLSLLRGFRGKAIEPVSSEAGQVVSGADGLPSAQAADAPPAYDQVAAEAGAAAPPPAAAAAAADKPKRDWFGRVVQALPKEAAPTIDGGGRPGDDAAPVPALPIAKGKAVSLLGGEAAAAEDGEAVKASSGGGSPGRRAVARSPKKQYEATSAAVVDGTLRHCVAFTWRDLGDDEGCCFRLGDTVLEEASLLFALAQVLLQKAKAEPLTDSSLLQVFQWLKASSGVLAAAVEVATSAKAPRDQTPDDLCNGLLPLLVEASLAQAQHITVRRAMATMRSNPALTHTLLARLCHDTSARYKAMEPIARRLCPDDQTTKGGGGTGVGAYVLAHLRYKQLYFSGMAYAMVGLERVTSDPMNLGFGIRDLLVAKELWDKAEVCARAFVSAARAVVFVDNLTILHQLNDCQAAADGALAAARRENDSVYYRPVPEAPDALPDRMSNLSPEAFDYLGTGGAVVGTGSGTRSGTGSGSGGGAKGGACENKHLCPVSPLWTAEAYAALDPTKAPKLHLGKIPEVVDCCPQS